MIARPNDRARRVLTVTLAAGALFMVAAASAGILGLRFNTTASMPRGLWRVRPGVAQLRRGDVVALCLPERTAREAAQRLYIGPGRCSGGYEALIKRVAAVAGDAVVVSPESISVNGEPVPGTAQLSHDSAGRPLQPIDGGWYRVAADEVWVLSGHTHSFDSRYFGPVPVSAVQGVAHPLWVIP